MGIALVVVIIAVVLSVRFMLDGAIKKGVETVGPMVTKVDVKLDAVSVSVLSGSGRVKGLVLGNPEGFKTPTAISVGSVSISMVPASVLSDKIVIKSVDIEAPEITYETNLKHNNLSVIMANIDAFTGGAEAEKPPAGQEAASQRKLQVDELVVSGGKIHVNLGALAGKAVTVPLPAIRLTNLGQGPEGITAAELTKAILRAIEQNTIQAAAGAVTGLGKEAVGVASEAGKAAIEDAGKQAGEGLGKAVKGMGGLFKKKE